MNSAFYFGIQSLRGGVSPHQVRFASELLDQDWGIIETYVRNRLVALHGSEAREEGWLSRQPLSRREELISAHRAARSFAGNRSLESRRTSGSTGVPFELVRSKELLAWMDAAMWAGYAWHGIGPGDKRLRFWGLSPAPLKRLIRRLADAATGQVRLSAFEIVSRRSVHFFARALRSGARYAYGYPTLMKLWAAECRAAGLDGRDLGLRCVISTGEVLTPGARRELTDFLGCPIINEYGCTESGVIAIECEWGTAHTVPVAALAEVVDEHGQQVQPGGVGQVVVSDLFGSTLPMLRYRLHDLARATGGAGCRCGRSLPAIEVTIGREGSFIVLPSGRQVFSTILAYTVPSSIAAFRARQSAPDLLTADVTLHEGREAASSVAAVQDAWGDALGRELRVEVKVVSKLFLEPSGKLRYFIPLGSTIPEDQPHGR